MTKTRGLLVAAALALTLTLGAACSVDVPLAPNVGPAQSPTNLLPSPRASTTPARRAAYLKLVKQDAGAGIRGDRDDASLVSLGETVCDALALGVDPLTIAGDGQLAQAALRAGAVTLCPEYAVPVASSTPLWPK